MTTALTGEELDQSVNYSAFAGRSCRCRACQSLISQVENGTREASEELVQAVATATGTPRSFFDFMLPDIPIGTLLFRKVASARQGDTKRVKALFDEAFRVVSELLDNANYPIPNLPVAVGEVAQNEIEVLADRTRALDPPAHHQPGMESTFATVRLRQRVTTGPGSRAAGVAMAFKLIESAPGPLANGQRATSGHPRPRRREVRARPTRRATRRIRR
jgi:hypothetical protein